ncbi:MAG TPA: KpsF/GutQ family sugar-phosphate isomerase [Bdellovibrionales bacterium]|nr:KpsF/GutQ family sugar-phosphate isomerase [Bdellovibrionales bacterium]
MVRDLEEASRVLEIEARAIDSLRARLGDAFIKAVDLLHACEGKVVITGMGKSGHVGRKIASTMSSTGMPAIFMHPAESSHGDLGVVSAKDVLIAISYGGETPELQDVLKFAARKGIPLIAMTGKAGSTLARTGTVFLDVGVEAEACPLGLAPTASSTATLALGDALAMCLLKRKGFKEEDFAEFHPGGSLGRRLLTRVADVMHTGDGFPMVTPETGMREVLALMTKKEVRGVAGVADSSGALVGVITDGDLRRSLDKSQNPLNERATDVMSKNPKTVDAEELAEKALFMMEQFSIQTLFVVRRSEHPARPVGLLHLQDLLKAKLR